MAEFPIICAQLYRSAGLDLANTRGTTITANALANTEGLYSTLIAATAFEANGVLITISSGAGGSRDFLVDVAVGAALSEQIIAPDLILCQGSIQAMGSAVYYLPLQIPAGTRISARCQSTVGSGVVRVHAQLISTGFGPSSPLGVVRTMGAAAGDSGGTSIDPGGTPNTEGAWTEIVAATEFDFRALLVGVGNQANATRTDARYLLDVGIGPATEMVLIPDIFFEASASADVLMPQAFGMFPVQIPKGTRLSVRARCSITDATDRLFDVILYGVA